jgi:hypothetical protein
VVTKIEPRTGTDRSSTRLGFGVVFVVVALVAASVLAGLGSASTSPSASQYQYGKKIAICHSTGSKKHPKVTLRIDIHAWPAHLQHGDTLGACPTPPAPTGKTIAICHSTGSAAHPWVTVRISIHAWPRHLQHGDLLGACPNPPPPPPVKKHGKGGKSDGTSTPTVGSTTDGGHGHHK